MSSQIIENILRSILISGIWISLVFLAYAPGRKLIRILNIREVTRLEIIIFSLSLGLGIIAFGIFLLGLAGLFKPWLMFALIFILAILSRDELISSLKNTPIFLRAIRNTWQGANYQGKGLIVISSIILFITYLQSLTPPWDGDGLFYHMEAPRQFLDAGRIIFIPESFPANYPMLGEMLFSLGIGLGLDQIAKLIHMTYGILLVMATYALGERYIGSKKGWMPAAILISTPMVVTLASFTYIDLIWGLYTLLGVYTILMWRSSRHNAWLLLAGLFSGFMVGTKYLGIGYVVILLGAIIWIDWNSDRVTRIMNILLFGTLVFFIGGLWYFKNLILTGNPVYPFFIGGLNMPMARVNISSINNRSFGTGNSILDYLLLPINLYIHQERFMTFLGEIEIPNPLFLLVAIIPLVKRKSPSISIMFAIVILGFIFWAMGSLQNRYLLPLFPFLSILSAIILCKISLVLPTKRLQRVFIPGILGGWLVFSLISATSLFSFIQPYKNVWGQETREDFLHRLTDERLINYNSSKFIQSELSPDDKVLMVWSHQTYYCLGRCIPDAGFSLWPYLYNTSDNMIVLTEQLKDMSVTHILINNVLIENLNAAVGSSNSAEYDLYSDLHKESYLYLVNEFIPTCTKEIYRDQYERLYELTCQYE